MNSVFNSDVALCSAPDLVCTPRALSSQARLAAEVLLAAKKSVADVFNSPVLRSALRESGYDDQAAEIGHLLAQSAEAEIVSCQVALGELDQATALFEEAWESTRDDYVEFRGTIRSLFAPRECSAIFGVYGQVSPQLAQFAAQATASYTRALGVRALEHAGYDEPWLQSALGALGRLVELDGLVQQRFASAAAKSLDRNRALAQYTNWVGVLLHQARIETVGLNRPPSHA
jgi:hypothetical protein